MDKTLGTGSVDRSARVRRIKRVIIGLIIGVIILPYILCIILFFKMTKLEQMFTELSYKKEKVSVVTDTTKVYDPIASNQTIEVQRDTVDIEKTAGDDTSDNETIEIDNNVEAFNTPTDERETTIEDAIQAVAKEENADNSKTLKRVYLTFDDGPSSNTDEILDILKEYDVKATFFVVGRLSDTTTPMYKRIVDEGHSIGMHSYTHKYNEIYSGVDEFVYDLERIQSLIYEQTGVMTKLYRFPGGSSNRVSRTDMSLLVDELEKRDIKYYDWNVVSGDAQSIYGLPKETLVRRCTAFALDKEEAIILMHDLPEKVTTVEALPEIIEYFKSIGVEMLPINESTPQIHLADEANE